MKTRVNSLAFLVLCLLCPGLSFGDIITNLPRRMGAAPVGTGAYWIYYGSEDALYFAHCPLDLVKSKLANRFTCVPAEKVAFTSFFGQFGDPNLAKNFLRLIRQRSPVARAYLRDLKKGGLARDSQEQLMAFFGELDSLEGKLDAKAKADLSAFKRQHAVLWEVYTSLYDGQDHYVLVENDELPAVRPFVQRFRSAFKDAERLAPHLCNQVEPGKFVNSDLGGCLNLDNGVVYGPVEYGSQEFDTEAWTKEGAIRRCSEVKYGGVGGWRVPLFEEMEAISGVNAGYFVKGHEINSLFVTLTAKESNQTKVRTDPVFEHTQNTGSQEIYVGTRPGSTLDPLGRHPIPVFQSFPTFRDIQRSETTQFSIHESSITLIQLSTGRPQEMKTYNLDAVSIETTTTSKDYSTRPRHILPGMGLGGEPTVVGTKAKLEGTRSESSARSGDIRFYQHELPPDVIHEKIALMCVKRGG